MFNMGQRRENSRAKQVWTDDSEGTVLYCQNMNGHPGKKTNRHKMKEIHSRYKEIDLAVILESGINTQNKLWTCSDHLKVTQENLMEERKN